MKDLPIMPTYFVCHLASNLSKQEPGNSGTGSALDLSCHLSTRIRPFAPSLSSKMESLNLLLRLQV